MSSTSLRAGCASGLGRPDETGVVLGRSMEPTLEHRAIVLVDFQRTVRRRNKIFAMRTDDGPVVKRLHRTDDGWRLVSDNKAYKPVPWPRDAQVLGQVMWTGRTL